MRVSRDFKSADLAHSLQTESEASIQAAWDAFLAGTPDDMPGWTRREVRAAIAEGEASGVIDGETAVAEILAELRELPR